ncbi:MAG TPA: tRNA (adenosine(37)-N6)-threonylcarbamoyltransferase complex transferase subunit TsaD [Vicinamibacterales bacterium]|jgi:tRNA N6-adenosine threonylcarbamoyltransferase|nr:tRNA (adenosine(37)-N6)-threonylcarbamoyltransferase complex transferase subunit TsaD [Vicinamibacterales bacterium]
MNLLAIETSCDETAAAVIAETGNVAIPWQIRSNVVASQVAIHREWGGVVPELASRQHVRDICGVYEAALEQASVSIDNVGAIAVTRGPGLVGSLLVGVAFAKALAWSRGLPVVPVHHLAGHIESLTLAHGELPLPAAVLVVSGGHTSLYFIKEPGRYQLIGRTRDDAAGEAYDKVAKLLGLGYPGGPAIDRVARTGNDRAYDFPAARLTHADRNAPRATADGVLPADVARRIDFSFSGLKTAVLRLVRGRTGINPDIRAMKAAASDEAGAMLSAAEVADIAASFQRTVVDALLDRTFEAARWLGARSVGIAGGVSANSRLRAEAETRGASFGIPVFIPPLALSTDNAAMIGAAGLRRLRSGGPGTLDFNAESSLMLE